MMEDSQPALLPWAKNGWDEIVPGLFMGGQYKQGANYREQHVKVRDEFDIVFSFFWENESNGPDPDIAHIHFPIPDGSLGIEELARVRREAVHVANCVRAGNKVLVRCQAGLNRSGLVVAFALMELGHDVHSAVDMIRDVRSAWALNRLVFLRYLLEAS